MKYNRVLHSDDYVELEPWRSALKRFKAELHTNSVPFREDHEHREWEYSMILRQLMELQMPADARILDTGSGASYIIPYLIACGYKNVICSDSFGYGDPTDWVYQQSRWLGADIPILQLAVEDMSPVADESFDVAMCISTIEHIAADKFTQALKELFRITKKGGYVFITSDFFENLERAEESPFRSIQHTIFTPNNVFEKLSESGVNATFVGEILDGFAYRGDFVNNYSFINLCLQKQ